MVPGDDEQLELVAVDGHEAGDLAVDLGVDLGHGRAAEQRADPLVERGAGARRDESPSGTCPSWASWASC